MEEIWANITLTRITTNMTMELNHLENKLVIFLLLMTSKLERLV